MTEIFEQEYLCTPHNSMEWVKTRERFPEVEESNERRSLTINVLARIKTEKPYVGFTYDYYVGFYVLKGVDRHSFVNESSFTTWIDGREVKLRILPNEWFDMVLETR